MEPKENSISVLIPAYNEERNIEQAILMNKDILESLGLDYEIIIIDDGSQDKTTALAEAISDTEDKIKLVRNPINLGFGGAIKTGIKNSLKNYIIIVPCDSPLETEELREFFAKMGRCDIIVSYRRMRKGYSRYMLFNSFIYNKILIPLFFNLGLRDANWIHMYRRAIFDKHLIDIEYNGIFMLVEIIYKAKKKDLIIGEVPGNMKRRVYGTPSSVKLQVIFRTFWDMINFWFRIHFRSQKNIQTNIIEQEK